MSEQLMGKIDLLLSQLNDIVEHVKNDFISYSLAKYGEFNGPEFSAFTSSEIHKRYYNFVAMRRAGLNGRIN